MNQLPFGMDGINFLLDDRGLRIHPSTILSIGTYAVVIRQNDVAIKMPIVHSFDGVMSIHKNRAKMQAEQLVYRQLMPDPTATLEGVVPCVRMWSYTIELQYMSQGTLGVMLQTRGISPIPLQRRWIRQLATGLRNIHARRVLHNDLALRNILLDGSLNVMITDFGVSSIVPLGLDMMLYRDRHGCSMWTDLVQLGSIIYHIVTGVPSRVTIYPQHDLYAVLPPRNIWPDVRSLWAGQIIEDCWNAGALGPAGAQAILNRLDHLT